MFVIPTQGTLPLQIVSSIYSKAKKGTQHVQDSKFFKTLLCCISCCFNVPFAYNLIQLIHEYNNEKTGFNQLEHPMNELEFPAATVCATELFKNVDNETKADNLLQNLKNYTFSLDEFMPQHLAGCQGCYVQEMFSYKDGLCYTVKTSVKQIKGGPGRPILYLTLNKSHKYQVRK